MDETVAMLKERIAIESGIEAGCQRLIYRGHVLKDAQSLQELVDRNGLEDGHTMHLVRSAAAKAPPVASTASPAPSSATAGTAGGTVPSGSPSPAASTMPVQGFGTGSAPFGGGFPSGGFGGMGGGMGPGLGGGMDFNTMQQQLMQNPEMMRQMMDSPMMQSVLQNPELMRSMIMANPQVQELVQQNPELAHVLNDPNNLRQAMEMARNPAMMNEMMRNTDRAMANIEMMPGGFDALRRMHENVQAPLQDAMASGARGTLGGSAANAPAQQQAQANSDNPFASLFGPTVPPSTQPMPNPWNPSTANTPANSFAPSTPAPNSASSQTPDLASMFANAGANANGGAFGGAGVNGMGGMPNAFGADPASMLQMLENPMVQQMMQSMLADPAMRENLINANPMLREGMSQNPQMAQLLQNPEFLRMMMNPEVLRASLTLQNAMRGSGFGPQSGGLQAGTPTPSAPANTSTPQPDLEQLMNMFANTGRSGGPTGGGVPNAGVNAPPTMSREQLEQMYSSQLQQLRDMGFMDTEMCINALRSSGGNVNLAVERLLNQFGQ